MNNLNLGKADQSLFRHLQEAFEQPLPVIHLQKSGLVELSQALKKTVVRRQLASVVLTSLQPFSETKKVRRWYERLAQQAKLICLFAPHWSLQDQIYDDARAEALLNRPAHELEIMLPADHALVQEWFIVLLTEEASMLICAKYHNLPDSGAVAGKQVADVILSYNPQVIEKALDFLSQLASTHRPESLAQIRSALADLPPVLPQPDFLMWLSVFGIKHFGVFRRETRQEDQESAMRATIARLLHDASQPVTTLVNLLEMADRYKQLDNYEIELLLNSANDLKQILDRLREVNRFRTNKVENTYYLDTGNPFYKAE